MPTYAETTCVVAVAMRRRAAMRGISSPLARCRAYQPRPLMMPISMHFLITGDIYDNIRARRRLFLRAGFIACARATPPLPCLAKARLIACHLTAERLLGYQQAAASSPQGSWRGRSAAGGRDIFMGILLPRRAASPMGDIAASPVARRTIMPPLDAISSALSS